MALCRQFVCSHCPYVIESWDEGNPYYYDQHGQKIYAYHPDPDRDLCIGIDSPHLCLDCGMEFNIDSNAPTYECPQCSGRSIVDTFQLDGKTCPACHKGTLTIDPDFFAVS